MVTSPLPLTCATALCVSICTCFTMGSLNSFSIITLDSEKPFSTSPYGILMISPGMFLPSGVQPLSACNSGASSFIASSASKTAGSSSYSTLMSLSASSAISSVVAATAATSSPTYLTTSSNRYWSRTRSRCATVKNIGAAALKRFLGPFLCVIIALTPGSFSASVVSISTILACG